MKSSHSLQGIIGALHEFWVKNGCTIWQPHSEKVGAGTMNPATFMKVLGPEPWNVAYVEPSYRADDGRFAENPNRMQMHTQYQVVLKPDPGNPQELYLASLSALGLDRSRHDIRFVEDNWESPALGAWGLGWEVWLDGQEITQFTYFQQAGGQMLDPVSVEITYGLERIAMFLQGRSEVWTVDVDGLHSYADLYRTQEVEHSHYNFNVASVERLQALHKLYQEEAGASLERGLANLAYDYLLRQSHNFNLLDARGAIGVTERALFFGEMRKQARAVANLHVKERERLEYPFITEATPAVEVGTEAKVKIPEAKRGDAESSLLLVEVGVEELPSHEVANGLRQLQVLVPEQLAEHRLAHGNITVAGTVRRFVIQVQNLVARQTDEEILRRGPSLKAAFHVDGTPSKAAEGFARSCGLPVDRLIQQNDYLYARILNRGKATATVLPELLAKVMNNLRWAKTMRWNASGCSFPRPVRWLMVIMDSVAIPFAWAGVAARPETRGPRYSEALNGGSNPEVSYHSVASPGEYLAWLDTHGVILNRTERKAAVLRQVNEAAADLDGLVHPDNNLLDEVTDLVEAPRVLAGTFPQEYLKLPVSVLITVMQKHQRYFPVYKRENPEKLLPHFLTVANGLHSQVPDTIRAGNESVVNARFADAAFFVKRDLASSLEDLRLRLRTLTFHAQLGTMWDKAQRLRALIPPISSLINLNSEDRAACERAADLCKLDLVMQMVVEMTSLQGIMMEHYARSKGEKELVCQAIREHYQPRSAEDRVPESRAGLTLGIADRLDSLVGLMAVGVHSSGNSDPFGLRRLGLGLVKGLLKAGLDFDLQAGIAAAAQQFDIEVTAENQHAVLVFLQRRLRILMREQEVPIDVINAVTAASVTNPVHAVRVAQDLKAVSDHTDWKEQLLAYVRCARILPGDFAEMSGTEMHFVEEVERILFEKIKEANRMCGKEQPNVAAFRSAMALLQPVIEEFFEKVMVLSENPDLQRSRLQMMADIRRLGLPLGDLIQLQT